MMMRRLNVGSRAAIAFSIIVAIMVALGVFSIAQMRHLRQTEVAVETDWLPSVRQAGQMTAALLRLRLESVRSISVTNPSLSQEQVGALTELRNRFADTVKSYAQLVSSDEERALYQTVQNSTNDYLGLLDQFQTTFRNGDTQSAVNIANSSMRAAGDRLQELIEKLVDLNDRGAKASGVQATQVYDHGMTWTCGLILTSILVTVIMASLLTRSITAPIGEALRIAQRIAGKDLSKDIVVEGTDEAAGLLTALASMQGNLRRTIGHLADTSNQLAAAAEQMTAVIEEGNRGLLKQNDEVNQVATAVTEMSSAVDEVARNAEETAVASQQGSTLTQTGLNHMGSTFSAIERLATEVGVSSNKIETLSSRAQEISNVVEVIRSIAEQTNLLALNAAIEAARAGDQGRGFAVVADEVRALAHRTQQSTREIEAMINAVQKDSADAVHAMQQSSQTATSSLIVAQEANSALQAIALAMSSINDRNALIATAAEEQAIVAREIDRGLISIKGLSHRGAEGSSQTAGASSEVSSLAHGLKQVVAEFVI